MISVKGINKYFGENHVLKDISFHFERGKTNLISGESGSGKSVTALAIMRLIRSNSQLKIAGSATYEKKNLLNSDEASLQNIRGKKISMIFFQSAKHYNLQSNSSRPAHLLNETSHATSRHIY